MKLNMLFVSILTVFSTASYVNAQIASDDATGNAPRASTVGQINALGHFSPNSDGNIPCPCNETQSPISPEPQWASLEPGGAAAPAPGNNTEGTDSRPSGN